MRVNTNGMVSLGYAMALAFNGNPSLSTMEVSVTLGFQREWQAFIVHKLLRKPYAKAYACWVWKNNQPYCRYISEVEDYYLGKLPPRYPIPALADTATVMCLTLGAHCIWEHDIAWDDIWQEDIPDYVPFICPL